MHKLELSPKVSDSGGGLIQKYGMGLFEEESQFFGVWKN